MAISSAGITIKYAVETTAGTRPTTGYLAKAASGTLNINQYVTGISGIGAEWEQYDVTPLAATERHQFVKGLMGNDGSISLNANIDAVSRADWDLVVADYTALTGGKGMWFEFTLPGETQSTFVRGEPCAMMFPDVEAASAVQGAIQIIENDYAVAGCST